MNTLLPDTKTMQEAFEKANEEMGFTAYSSLNSYNIVKKRKKARR
jgi:hypothetical protein